jgi:hypothetical protein
MEIGKEEDRDEEWSRWWVAEGEERRIESRYLQADPRMDCKSPQ